MKISIKDIDVNYIQYGKGKEDILLLHGWGQNIEMMKPIGDHFSEKYRITILDFPGFGESEEPKEAWSIDDYVDVVKELIKKIGIKNPIVIGHSFGGRVAIKYVANNESSKLILFGSPCIRTKEVMTLKVKVLKKLKTLPGMNQIGEKMKKYIGSRDYKAASPIMRQTLVNTVNEDLSSSAKKIKIPALLVWGVDDTEAPIEDAKELEKIIEDAALITLPGTHYAYLENLYQVVKIITAFLEGGN